MVKKTHKKAEPDPIHGLYEAATNGSSGVLEYEPDTELRDTEQVPLLEEGGIEAFFKREVLPHATDAWIDASKTKIGYEISFTRHFYKPPKLRTLKEIKEDIGHLWEQQKQIAEAGGNGERGELLRQGQSPLPDSFLDKSFRLRFEVPPPVLSNWKAFLIQLVEEALPEHRGDDAHLVYRVFNHSMVQQREAPTPRELKIFVNQIGAIHRQWGHAFPIGHAAYYVALRRRRIPIIQELAGGTIPDSTAKAFLGEGLTQSLAGLAFNVPPHVGQQLLLGEPIWLALTDDAEDGPRRLAQLEGTHGDGFWAVLEDAVSARLVEAEPAVACRAAWTISSSSATSSTRPEYRSFASALASRLSQSSDWPLLNREIGVGLAAALGLIKQVDCSKRVISSLQARIAKIQEDEQSDEAIDQLVEGLATILPSLATLGSGHLPSEPFQIPGGAAQWLTACRSIEAHDSEGVLPEHLRPAGGPDAVIDELVETVQGGRTNEDMLAAVGTSARSPALFKWTKLAQAAEQRLQIKNNASGAEAALVLKLLATLRRLQCPAAEEGAKRLVDNGHLAHCFHHAASQQHAALKGWGLATYARHRPGFEKPTPAGNSEQGYAYLISALESGDKEIAESLLQAWQDEKDPSLVWRVVEERKRYDPLIIRALRMIADGDDIGSVFTSEVVLLRWRELVKHLNEKTSPSRFETLVKQLCETHNLINEIMTSTGGFISKDASLYAIILKAGAATPEFREWCGTGIRSADDEDWKQALCEKNGLVELLVSEQIQASGLQLDHHLQDAIAHYGEAVLKGEVTPSDALTTRMSTVLTSLEPNSDRPMLRTRLLEAASKRDGDIPDKFFGLWGDELTDQKAILRNDEVVRRLFLPIIRRKSLAGVSWLADVAQNNPKVLGNDGAADAAQTDFRNRVLAMLGDADDEELHAAAVRIATAWDIQPVPENDAVTEQETASGKDASLP